MRVQTMRFRFDRKSGTELSRTVLDESETGEDKLGEMVACAVTGKSLDEIVRELKASSNTAA